MPETELSKEPSYFSDVTPPWAPEYATPAGYRAVFAAARNQRAVGEASTAYLSSPESAGRIYQQYPDARIIVILRNPAERAYSHYRLLAELGFERSATFERALAVEDERFERFDKGEPLSLDPFWFGACFYYRAGLYASQIERYQALFPGKHILFLLFEDLQKRPVETTREVFEFLDVDPAFEPNVKVHNKSYFPLSLRAQCFIGQRWNLHPVGARTRRPRIRDFTVLPVAFGLNLWLGNKLRTVKLNPDTRRSLLQRYKDDVARTGQLIGRNLDHWLKDRR
jgi:hypothetical protein